MNGPVLVTGGSGQVGTALQRLAPCFGGELVAPTRAELDLTDFASIERQVAAREWSAVINAGAYTAVDNAESEPELAHRINAEAPAVLARATAARGVPLLHVSTDYVFDGAKPAPYVEDDPVAPLGVYGVSKEAGERAVREGNPRHLILRTAWVFSPWGSNFVKTMLRLGAERPELGIVADQLGCPTSASDIAEALLTIAAAPELRPGTYHFVNAGEASWFDFAQAIFERAPVQPKLRAIATADYPTPAKRPANSRLATDKIMQHHAIRPRPWQDALDEVMEGLT